MGKSGEPHLESGLPRLPQSTGGEATDVTLRLSSSSTPCSPSKACRPLPAVSTAPYPSLHLLALSAPKGLFPLLTFDYKHFQNSGVIIIRFSGKLAQVLTNRAFSVDAHTSPC